MNIGIDFWMYIQFDKNSKTIKIKDEAKPLSILYILICLLQIISSFFQILNYWNDFNDFRFYLFAIVFLLHFLALIYFIFYNSTVTTIKHDEIEYFKVKNILGLKFRFIKLQNNKIRLLNFKKSSKEIQSLKQYFKDNNLVLKL